MLTYLKDLYSHKTVLRGLVSKEFNSRFRSSALGYLWHVITPLSMIVIYLIVFSYIFGKNIENYWIYLSSGIFAFTFFSSTLNGGSTCITGNTGMVTKMHFPPELIVISKVVSNLITATISYAVLLCIIIITGSELTLSLLSFIPVMGMMAMFALGVALIVSSLNVYFRDIAHIVSLLSTCLMFATPIFYMRNQMDSEILGLIWAINPIQYFVECFHSIIYHGTFPTTYDWGICILLAIGFLVLGILTFNKLKRKFAELL